MSEILGIFGLQGWGKTALTTYFGLKAYEMGYNVYSNYPLGFDYTPISSLEEAQNCRNGYLLMDEIWKWVHARTSQKLLNQEMMAICLLNRKRKINIIYNSQLRRTIDVILREVTTYRYLPQMVKHDNNKFYIHYVVRDLIDRESEEMVIPIPIDEIGQYFNTDFEIKKLTTKNESFLEIGKDLEKKFVKAINKIKGFTSNLNPNSGINTPYKYDIDLTTKHGRFGLDIKSTGIKNVTICNGSNIKKEMNKFLQNAKKWHYNPYISFPLKGKKGNLLNYPNNWFIYPIYSGSYLLNMKGKHIDYNKLIKQKETINLKKWDGKPFNTKI